MMSRARRPAVVLTLDGLPIDEIVLAGPRMHHLSANVASKQSGNSHRNPFLRHLVNCRAFRALEYDYYPHDNAGLARQNNRRDVIASATNRTRFGLASVSQRVVISCQHHFVPYGKKRRAKMYRRRWIASPWKFRSLPRLTGSFVWINQVTQPKCRSADMARAAAGPL